MESVLGEKETEFIVVLFIYFKWKDVEIVFKLQLLRTSLTYTDTFRIAESMGMGKKCSRPMTSSPKSQIFVVPYILKLWFS